MKSYQGKLPGGEPDLELLKEIPFEEARDVAQNILTVIDVWCQKIDIVGSIRRKKPKINDIDFVVVTTDKGWKILRGCLVMSFKARKVLSGKKIHRYLIPFKVGALQVDFYRATEDTYGIQKLIRTGSAEHNIYLAKLAIRQGKRLQYSKGLIKVGTVIAAKYEHGVFDKLGLPFIAPEMREIVRGEPAWKGKI